MKIEVDERVLEIYSESTGVDWKYLQDLVIDSPNRFGLQTMISFRDDHPRGVIFHYHHRLELDTTTLSSWRLLK